MLAEFGLAALWLAAALAALQIYAGLVGWRQPDGPVAALVKPVAVAQAALVTTAFLSLIALFLRTDLSVRLVVMNSHAAKPWLYKFAGTWGNHEGSMLLWVTVLAVAGAMVALLEKRLEPKTLVATLGAQALIGLGFYGFLLIASNPFARQLPAASEGQGLNPLLQDPGLAFHPPTLYFGYVGISIAFAFAVGALITRDVGPAFARAMRPWVLISWIFLTVGIVAGSYWAYYELGWGGWWFWDPVENASLMPWLAATALLHSVTVLATRDGLRAWTVMLAVVAFSMSMVGTFLVRSGILTSVHSFAVDPQRGSFLLLLLAIYIGGALALFGLRIGTVREGNQFDPLSREAGLVINNLLLSVLLAIVFIGTLYPLAAEVMTGEKLSIGPPYFNSVSAAPALILVVLMGVGPLIRWRRDEPGAVARRILVPALALLLAAVVAVVIWGGKIGILPLLGLIVAGGTAVASLAPLAKRNLRRTPLFTWGMVIAHLGVAVSLAGMAADSAFMQERLIAMKIGDVAEIGDFHVRFHDVRPVAGPNWTAVEAELQVSRGSSHIVRVMVPESRQFWSPMTETSEAAIATLWDGQLYTVIGKADGAGGWQMRLWWKPFVTLIWVGGLMIALGGLLALIGRLWREGGAEVWKNWRADRAPVRKAGATR